MNTRALYQIEVTCTQRMRTVLMTGLLICLFLTGFLGQALVYPLLAQARLDKAEARLDDAVKSIASLQVQVATVGVEVRLLSDRVTDLNRAVGAIQSLQWQTLVALLVLTGTAAAGLLGILWNLRSGWLKVKAE